MPTLPNISAILLLTLAAMLVATAADPLDTLVFSDPTSEQAHAFSDDQSDIITGGLDERTRRLLPREPLTWDGGRVAFTLRVDPQQPTYLTVRLWGGDVNSNRLMLFVDGKQVGYRHLGDVEIIDTGSSEPALPGRFFYHTTPLPLAMTRGRTSLACEIRASGRIWGYGRDFAQYQKVMEGPSRGIYRVYTHIDGCFTPPAIERQGSAPQMPPLRTTPGAEVIEQARKRVLDEFNSVLDPKRRGISQMQAHFLARARHVAWIPGRDDPRLVAKVVAAVDDYCARRREDPAKIHADPATWNPEWFGVGPLADAVRLLEKELQPVLDQPLPGQPEITRRAAWADLFQDSRDWLCTHRRQYTNQAMIVDMNLYRSNRGLRVVAPERAFPEAKALRYLHEAVGIMPWLGSDTPQGPSRPLGDEFLQLTTKGLTRELGYVGYYGEVLDWIIQILESTGESAVGDPALRAQLVKAAAARAPFRHPALDENGNRAMRIEAVIGWRDDHYPGTVTYGMRGGRDASCLALAATLRDAVSIGVAQQMLADGQLYASIQEQMGERGLRVTMGLLDVPDHHAWLLAQKPSSERLPMSPGRPDFVFTDEEDGVVALKRGDEILYVSLYWRARNAVNFLARVHHLMPHFDRIAVVRQETVFTPSGQTWKRPDWVNFGFANGGMRYPGDLHSAMTGEELPIAKVPDGVSFKPGQENMHAGRGTFYRLAYGEYLIGMNMGATEPQRLLFPVGLTQAKDLVSGRVLKPDAQGGVMIPPRSTVVVLKPVR